MEKIYRWFILDWLHVAGKFLEGYEIQKEVFRNADSKIPGGSAGRWECPGRPTTRP